MKKVIIFLIIFFLLNGCSNKEDIGVTENIVLLESEISKLSEQVTNLETKLIENEKEINEYIKDKSEENHIIEKLTLFKDLEELSNYSEDIILHYNRFSMFEDLINKFIKTSDRYQEIYCYIKKYDESNNEIEVDLIEFLTPSEDWDKLSDLGIEEDSLPNGYYIFNESEEQIKVSLDKYTTCIQNELWPQITNKSTFFRNMIAEESLCILILIDGQIYQVLEKYLP